MNKMRLPQSIRWRLPLSYALIALLTTLALGFVLLTTLQNHYQQQELNYLTTNAKTISTRLTPLIEADLPAEALQEQLNTFAFLSQTQVRLLDRQSQLLADSGPASAQQEVMAISFNTDFNIKLKVDGSSQTLTQTMAISTENKSYASFIVIKKLQKDAPWLEQVGEPGGPIDILKELAPDEDVLIRDTVLITTHEEIDPDYRLMWLKTGLPEPPQFISFFPTVGTPYGFEFSADQAADGRRSHQRVSQPLYDDAHTLLGYVEVSNGPAYGGQILKRVAQGWAIASGVAVLLAAGAGWFISRRISAPLLNLTGATARMAAGDLSARAQITRQDELGTLAGSFNEMAQQVEETVITLRRFVADAAHELHTPLTALRTNLELAAEDISHVKQQPFIKQAQIQAARLESLTTDLLDLSRLETGAREEGDEEVDLVHLLRDIAEPYASQAEQANLSFSLQLPQEKIIVQGNTAHLRRAVSNLLDNALKFTPEGGAIQVGLRHCSGPNGIELWVEDTGIGIPPDELPQLFSRFHRARNALTYPGSGLGLAIVKAIVEGHGGQVMAENTAQGARFTIRLLL